MSGKHITQEQENLYMKSRQAGLTQEIASAKAGGSVRTGRRIEKGEKTSIGRINALLPEYQPPLPSQS